VQMLGTKPWNSVIETKSARDEILLKGAALRATSPGRSADTVRDRSPGKQLYSAAYKLFHEADTNHDGMLDEEELGMLLLMLRKRMGKPLQGLDRAKCVEHAIISMAAVDTTGIGRIGFEAFVKMLNAKPWCDVLDASTRSELSHVQRRNIAMLKDKEDPADSFLAKAEALFEDLDSDQDKVLNMNELVVLTCRLLEIQGRDGSCKTELEATASSALTTYGDGETLSFEEFVQMLGAKPWNSVVDSDQAQDAILLKGAGLRSTNPDRAARSDFLETQTGSLRRSPQVAAANWKPPPRSSAQPIDGEPKSSQIEALAALLERMFNESTDSLDGEISSEQVLDIFAEVVVQFGAVRENPNLQRLVCESMQSDTASYRHLIRMLAMKRWRKVIPVPLHDQILVWAQRPEFRPVADDRRDSSPSRKLKHLGKMNPDECKQKLLELNNLLQSVQLLRATENSLCVCWPHAQAQVHTEAEYAVHLAVPGAVSEVVALLAPEDYEQSNRPLLKGDKIHYTIQHLEANVAYSVQITGSGWRSAPAKFTTGRTPGDVPGHKAPQVERGVEYL